MTVSPNDINRNVPLARPGEFSPLAIGPLRVWPPVVLAPMAGITNAPFRTLCREFGAGLYVSEMITARLLAARDPRTLALAAFAPDETPRSLQLYGTDPYHIAEAVALLVGEGRVDHIDMNFGCPVRKVTRKGGGAAIPLKPKLLRSLVRAAVTAAGGIPVTIKFRIGIDDTYQTYLSAGRIAEEEGCAAVALHARTASQLYAGEARWEAIAALKQAVTSIPVLGNGDIWEACDALRMMRTTGCDGVVVGRGCLGRPWLFREIEHYLKTGEKLAPAAVSEIHAILLAHLEDLYDFYGLDTGFKVARKHISWYTKGLIGSAAFRKVMNTLPTVELQHQAVNEFFLRYAEEHEHLQYEDNKTQEEALAA